MAFRSTLELYSNAILPRLAEGPMTVAEMGVPQYAVETLGAHGLIKARMFRTGAVAVQVWFLPEDLELLEDQPLAFLRKRCDELEAWDWPPGD